MLSGEYIVQLGEKNRLAIPKRLREILIGKIIITKGFDKSLLMVDGSRWNRIIAEINKSALFKKNTREIKRYLIGSAVEIEYDLQGRFVMPETLKRFGELKNEVVFVGVGEWIEIWDKENWNRKISDLEGNLENIAEIINSI